MAESVRDEDERSNDPSSSMLQGNSQASSSSRAWHNKRVRKGVVALALLLIASIILFSFNTDSNIVGRRILSTVHPNGDASLRSSIGDDRNLSDIRLRQPLSHFYIPASNASPDLCKLILTAAALDYPQPKLLAWNDTFTHDHMMAGGSHMAKIHTMVAALKELGQEKDDELVLMVDGYDIWFQLPPEVLVNRYYEILEQVDARLVERLGPDAMDEIEEQGLGSSMANKIVFAAGKRCAPNQPHSMACYPLPESPLPDDLYGINTDLPIGHNKYYSVRQRFINSGYIIGPVKAMRHVFGHAQNQITERERIWLGDDDTVQADDVSDNGSHGSGYFYHGSDQSIFAKIWGRQEYVREVLRRRWNPHAGGNEDPHNGMTVLERSTKVDDLLNPAWSHELWDQDPAIHSHADGKLYKDHVSVENTDAAKLLELYDYGITLDYFSDLGHQTVNSVRDGGWLIHGKYPLASQLGNEHDNPFDCRARLSNSYNTHSFPADISNSPYPSSIWSQPQDDSRSSDLSRWLSTPLYTHICLSTSTYARIPVMIHHNGEKGRRATTWHEMSWLYNVARTLLEDEQQAGGAANTPGFRRIDVGGGDLEVPPGRGGASTDKGYNLSWKEVCPKQMLDDGGIFPNA